jgi:hypothetical protein
MQSSESEIRQLRSQNLGLSKLLTRARIELRKAQAATASPSDAPLTPKLSTSEPSNDLDRAFSITEVLNEAGIERRVLEVMTEEQLCQLISRDISTSIGRMLFRVFQSQRSDQQGRTKASGAWHSALQRISLSLSTRSKFRQTLNDAIGEVPKGKCWKAELTAMLVEGLKARGLTPKDRPHYGSADVFLDYSK